MTKTVEHVLFYFPYDDELFIAAVTMMQQWVNNYQARSKANDVTRGNQEFEFVYRGEIKIATNSIGLIEDHILWKYLLENKLELNQLPSEEEFVPDIVFDMSDERLNSWKQVGKHAVQVCGIICGEECRVLPKLRQVKPSIGTWIHMMPGSSTIKYAELTAFEDYQIVGILGGASGFTYLAAAMGLPVIEIVPAGRPKSWLSKWINRGYRMIVDTGDNVENTRLVNQAKASVEAQLREVK